MNNGLPKKHILSMLVDNEPGVLSRVAGLFSGRGFNIDSMHQGTFSQEYRNPK